LIRLFVTFAMTQLLEYRYVLVWIIAKRWNRTQSADSPKAFAANRELLILDDRTVTFSSWCGPLKLNRSTLGLQLQKLER